jgi:hypothetical protein
MIRRCWHRRSAPGAAAAREIAGCRARKAAPAGGPIPRKLGGSIPRKSGGPIPRKSGGSNHRKSCSWRGWYPISPVVGENCDCGIGVSSQPVSAVWSNPVHLDLFVTSANGQIMTTYWDASASWQEWYTVGPQPAVAMPGQCVTAVWRNSAHLDVFITGATGRILTTFWEPQPGWHEWYAIEPEWGAATPGQTVTALWSSPNHLDLFICGVDGRILTTYWEPSAGWLNWYPIMPDTGVATPGQCVTAIWSKPGVLELFVTSSAGQILNTSWDIAGGWLNWVAIEPASGAALPGQTVTAILGSPDNLQLFITSAQGHILTASRDATGSWRPWSSVPLDGFTLSPGQTITAVTSPARDIDIFVTTNDGRVCTAHSSSGGTWMWLLIL